jgi:mutator protein MutT
VPHDPTPVEIAAAVIFDAAGRVLVARRAAGTHLAGHHEFPGGKVLPGESAEDACKRECREELGVNVEVLGPMLPRFEHRYPDRTVALSFFRCVLAPGSPPPRALSATEVRWLEPAALPGLDWPRANASLIALLAGSAPRR